MGKDLARITPTGLENLPTNLPAADLPYLWAEGNGKIVILSYSGDTITSQDGGPTWVHNKATTTNLPVCNDLKYNDTDQTFYAASRTTVYKSVDGITWTTERAGRVGIGNIGIAD